MNVVATQDFQYTVGRPLFRLPKWMRLAFWLFSIAVVGLLTVTGVLLYDWQQGTQKLIDLKLSVDRQQKLNDTDMAKIKQLEKNAQQQKIWYPLFQAKFSAATMLAKTLEVVPTTISFIDLNWGLGTKSWGGSALQFTSESMAKTKEEAGEKLTNFREEFVRTSGLQILSNNSNLLRQKPTNINGMDTRLFVMSEQWTLEASTQSIEDVTEHMKTLSKSQK